MLTRWTGYLLSFALAAAIVLWITPRLRDAALRFGIVDRPDGELKRQAQPVPYLGGLALYLGVLLSLAATFRFNQQILGLLLAGSIVVIVGLIDDLGQLGPWTKLAGQAVAVLVLINSGIYIKLVALPGWLALGLSVLWLLAVTNAFNLIDIMDGLSAGTAGVAALVLAVMADVTDRVAAATLLAALGGACLAFLRYNFAPARIYMGDAGSMFLGLLLGALAMNNAYTQHNQIAAVAPALILGVPLFDMLFVMYIRKRRGMPVMMGSSDHVALRLRHWRLSTRQTVVLSWGVTALLGAAAVAISLGTRTLALVILGSLAALGLVAAVWLRRIDMGL